MNLPNGENKRDVLEEIDDLCKQLERITAKIKMLQFQQKAEELQEHKKGSVENREREWLLEIQL